MIENDVDHHKFNQKFNSNHHIKWTRSVRRIREILLQYLFLLKKNESGKICHNVTDLVLRNF